MILGDSRVPAQQLQGQRRVTIDEVFRRVASKHPDKLALTDAPNRRSVTGTAPRRLTYAEADRMVETAQKEGVKLIAGHTSSYGMGIRAMRKLAQTAELGPVRSIFIWSYTDWMIRAFAWWGTNRSTSAGSSPAR